jgi:hypothetical protein
MWQGGVEAWSRLVTKLAAGEKGSNEDRLDHGPLDTRTQNLGPERRTKNPEPGTQISIIISAQSELL